MPNYVSLSDVRNRASIASGAKPQVAHTGIRELTTLAVRGLNEMFDAEKQLFCFRLKPFQGRMVREALSRRYTIMSLLGLQRLEAVGVESPIRVRTVLDGLLRDRRCITGVGDLGLILWLCALAAPERLEEAYSNFKVQAALAHFQDARDRKTMELAWFLSGLAHASAVRRQTLPGLSDLAVKTYRLLKENQGSRGPFGHLARSGTLAGVLRGHIGSFADQVYPIYALSTFARVFQIRGALLPARECADAICRVQGVLGQWWWHYHSQTGEVLEHYPVYAVHQHGMAPMALFALTEADRVDFSEPVYKGLHWITGDNELAIDLRLASDGIVWRSIYHRSPYGKYFGNAMTLIGFSNNGSADDLKIKFECRPYELGWLLYAFAGRDVN